MTDLRHVAIAATVLCSLLVGRSGLCQTASPTPKEFPLWKFDEMTTYPKCRAKGRMQDKGYCDSKLVDQIVAKGKAAIPILISQLTDNPCGQRIKRLGSRTKQAAESVAAANRPAFGTRRYVGRREEEKVALTLVVPFKMMMFDVFVQRPA